MTVVVDVCLKSPGHVMICTICLKTIGRIGSEPGPSEGPSPELFGYAYRSDSWTGAHHITRGSLIRSVNEGCYICNPLLGVFPRQARWRAHCARSFYEIRPDGVDRWSLRITIELPADHPYPPEVIESHGTFRILPKNVLKFEPVELHLTGSTSSTKCQEQVQSWLYDCTYNHSACNRDWRTNHQYLIRLLNLSNGIITLEEFEPGKCPEKYVTLSHCWDNGAEKPLSRLTMKSLPEWKAGVTEDRLSAKFQDAATVARWMDVTYLWIDALCIIQDSPNDWQSQSSVMGDIYAGSYCNIAAMSPAGEDGFLRQRQLAVIEPYLINHPQHDSNATTHVIGYDDFWCNSLLGPPLHNRAWVLQERQMSPRTIHFGEQVFWECREHKACEVYPTGIPKEFCNRRTETWRQGTPLFNPENKIPATSSHRSWLWPWLETVFPPRKAPEIQQLSLPKEEAYQFWTSLVERYMECELSYPSDKLVAIQGPANKVLDTTGERYLAGLWDNPDLAYSLLWYTPAKEQGNGVPSKKHLFASRTYRAPSWSWASLDATIVWKWSSQRGKQLIDVQSVSSQVHPRTDQVAAQPTELHIQGTLVAVRLEICNVDEHDQPAEDGSYDVQPVRGNIGWASFQMLSDALATIDPTILLDEALAPNKAREVYLLPCVAEWRGRPGHPAADVAGLILARRYLGSQTVYERIGVFCFDSLAQDDEASNVGGGDLQAALAAMDRDCITLI